jgi:hypothetical protein
MLCTDGIPDSEEPMDSVIKSRGHCNLKESLGSKKKKHVAVLKNRLSRAGNVHPITGHKGSEEEYSCTVSFNLGARWGWLVNATPRPFYPRERPGIHRIGGWMGPWAGLEESGKSRSHRDSIPEPSRRRASRNKIARIRRIYVTT